MYYIILLQPLFLCTTFTPVPRHWWWGISAISPPRLRASTATHSARDPREEPSWDPRVGREEQTVGIKFNTKTIGIDLHSQSTKRWATSLWWVPWFQPLFLCTTFMRCPPHWRVSTTHLVMDPREALGSKYWSALPKYGNKWAIGRTRGGNAMYEIAWYWSSQPKLESWLLHGRSSLESISSLLISIRCWIFKSRVSLTVAYVWFW